MNLFDLLAQAPPGPGALDALLRITGVTTTGVLLGVIYMWATRKIRTAGEMDEALKARDFYIAKLEKERDEWQEKAWEGVRLAERGAMTAAKATEVAATVATAAVVGASSGNHPSAPKGSPSP